ncbi:hypothetical protein H0H93_011692 [Arthromyces matolae]|nr:hypothetical protein H0H93_011692 [Arthromyces matolae]
MKDEDKQSLHFKVSKQWTSSQNTKLFQDSFTRERVLERARSNLGLYARLVREGEFIYRDSPTSLDSILAAHILLLVEPEYPDPFLRNLIKDTFPELALHAHRVLNHVSDPSLRISPPPKFVWSSLIPQLSAIQKQQLSEKSAHFRRMRWGFFGITAGTLAWKLTKQPSFALAIISFLNISTSRQQHKMDEDLIVVDDVDALEPEAGPSTVPSTSTLNLRHKLSMGTSSASTSRLRSGRNASAQPSAESSERTTRSSFSKNKPQPKLKLKLSDKAAAMAPGMSFLGQYDRELDSDDEELAFEEQFILRMSPGDDLEKLKKMVAAREVGNDVWFKFKGASTRIFVSLLGPLKLYDQMLVVDKKLENDEPVTNHMNFNIDEFIWPHGITPPLHHVRKRRFRKRVNRRTIESVEQEVERLLDEDTLATEVKYDILENVNPDLSDSEFIEREEPVDAPTPAISDSGEPQTPGYDMGDEGDDRDDIDEEEDAVEGDIDEDLAAELDLAMAGEDEDEGEGDDEEDEESEEDEEDEDEDDEDAQARKLLNEEVRDLEAAVAKKEREVASSANPLIKKRFEDALKKLTADLEMKLAQRDELKEMQRLKKEGLTTIGPDTDDEGGVDDGPNENVPEGEDLFGSEDEMDLT